MKDQFDSYYAEKYTVKERNKVWENIAKKYQTIFQPFIEFINRQDPDSSGHKEMNHNYSNVLPPEKLGRASSADNSIVEPNDVATISCRIGDLVIPHAILDTGANDSLFTDNIPEYLGIKIDKKNVHKLTGAVGDSQSVGTSCNIPISIDSRKDSITVSEKEISVIPTKKNRNGNDISIMILGTK
ncbi:5619_t:CDS:2 [Paraglomus brasilianum]|uniref:5619_t:CDS:1 n=1 Tax=Paraglomus brasilianum TaxID=144538 RepID=A0A9N9DAR6_9GLOM|nr:5619_t:CDS:2 [Paraglomus brasilianum]